MPTMTLTEDFRRLCCSECGIFYFFPERWCKERGEDKRGWKCPNGHGQVFVDETEADKLRRERDRLTQRMAQKDDEIKQLEAQRRNALGQVTKLKKRVGNGVCPCCTRTFTNLQRHIETKHPDFKVIAAE